MPNDLEDFLAELEWTQGKRTRKSSSSLNTGSNQRERFDNEIHAAMPWDIPKALRHGELYEIVYLHAMSIVLGMDSLTEVQWDKLGRHYDWHHGKVIEFRQDWKPLQHTGFPAGWRTRARTDRDRNLLIRVRAPREMRFYCYQRLRDDPVLQIQLSPHAIELWTIPEDLTPWVKVWKIRQRMSRFEVNQRLTQENANATIPAPAPTPEPPKAPPYRPPAGFVLGGIIGSGRLSFPPRPLDTTKPVHLAVETELGAPGQRETLYTRPCGGQLPEKGLPWLDEKTVTERPEAEITCRRCAKLLREGWMYP